MKTKQPRHASRTGGILVIVMVTLVAFSLMVVALLQLGQHGAQETAYQLRRAQAFWLAEAGRQRCIADLYNGGTGKVDPPIPAANIPGGTFDVRIDSSNRISRGIVKVGNLTVTNQIRINLAYLARPYEHAIYAGNSANNPLWNFQLRGTGATTPPGSGSGGIDSIYGDVYIRGDAYMYEGSRIYPPNPNRYSLHGDLNTTGTSTLEPGATISGSRNQNVPYNLPPNLNDMDYAHNNDYDIAKIFNDLHITSGYLPANHPLRNVVVKNPSNRPAENNSTPGDDFYFEPSSISSAGNSTNAVTPLNLGANKVYYVDGHVWFNNHSTYGFKVDGTATIVSTRDIHVSDNLAYNNKGLTAVGGNPPDVLALVALGQYSGGVRTSGGDIYFGDPEFGTLYTVDAFMFANNNFYYNTRANNSTGQEQPESGFKVFGNYMAVNQVVVLRDWYTGADGLPHAASYDRATSQWKDAATGVALTPTQLATRRHYAMRVEYDDRIRDADKQPPGLPRGNGTIFAGEKGWEEIP